MAQGIISRVDSSAWLQAIVAEHPCFKHEMFDRLSSLAKTGSLSLKQVAALLKNYDAHASHLRRLLLKAATIMPEEAVGFILENVRNEYGNGVVEGRHQLQLQDLAWQSGVAPDDYRLTPVQSGIKTFIKAVTPFYFPGSATIPANLKGKGGGARAAIAAGAITATEIMAMEEFKALQKAFSSLGLQHHIWFDHVTVESEHSQESIALACFFQERGQKSSVEYGLKGVLEANVHLYDGLNACLSV
ncbi:MAG TPA: iron-containing redox enzyme family protein [Candidatus Obscuribacter sp.]|nr:iron-containing redox enzyme family protein [Candidatus Obscuribacter sp.]